MFRKKQLKLGGFMEFDQTELLMALKSLESQLVSLYAEKQEHGDPSALHESIRNLEAQLCDMYEERSHWIMSPASAQAGLESLEAQVISLTDEKMEHQKTIERYQQEIQELRLKAKALGAAVFEASMFGNDQLKKVG